MKKKYFIFLIYCLFISNCGSPPPNYVCVDVPFHVAECNDCCAVACIQMWAHYNRVDPLPTQCDMATVLGTPTMPWDTATGVSMYANAYAFVVDEPGNSNGLEQCISYGIVSLFDQSPCIYPVDYGLHAILAVGASYVWGPNDEPIGQYIEVHDPYDYSGEYVGYPANLFKQRYKAVNGYYYVIIGKTMYIRTGQEELYAFKAAGGTYYGDPISNLPSTEN